MREGRVLKTYNSFYYVQAENTVITCTLRGNLKNHQCRILTGDFVAFEDLPEHTGIIEKRLERKNLLYRPSVANVDQVILTFAPVQPDLHPLLLNRFLVLAEWSGIEHIVICVNKADLLPAGQQADFASGAFFRVDDACLR